MHIQTPSALAHKAERGKPCTLCIARHYKISVKDSIEFCNLEKLPKMRNAGWINLKLRQQTPYTDATVLLACMCRVSKPVKLDVRDDFLQNPGLHVRVTTYTLCHKNGTYREVPTKLAGSSST